MVIANTRELCLILGVCSITLTSQPLDYQLIPAEQCYKLANNTLELPIGLKIYTYVQNHKINQSSSGQNDPD